MVLFFRISRPNHNHMKQSDLGKSLDPSVEGGVFSLAQTNCGDPYNRSPYFFSSRYPPPLRFPNARFCQIPAHALFGRGNSRTWDSCFGKIEWVASVPQSFCSFLPCINWGLLQSGSPAWRRSKDKTRQLSKVLLVWLNFMLGLGIIHINILCSVVDPH
jgi:hypothetical protein